APPLDHDRIAVLISWRAAAEELERHAAGRGDGVDAAGWFGGGVSPSPRGCFLADRDPARPFEDVIDFLGLRMVMGRRARAWGQAGLGQALLGDAQIAMGQKLANLRAVLG